jgi:hypothetical protein
VVEDDVEVDQTGDANNNLHAVKSAAAKKVIKVKATRVKAPPTETDGETARGAAPAGAAAEDEGDVGTTAGGMRVAALGRAPVLRAPTTSAAPVMTAQDGVEMKVIRRGKDGQWLLVEVGGERGWVESARVKSLNEVPGMEPAVPVGRQGGGLMLTAATGYVAISQDFNSNSTAYLGKYHLSSSAAAIGVGALYSYIRGIWEFGADAGYRFTAAAPGVQVPSATGMSGSGDLAILEHTVDVGLRAGYRSPEGMGTGIYLRAGYYLNAFGIDRSSASPLPSETVAGVTAGAGMEMPRLTERLGVRVHADYLLTASRDQTTGLRDGKDAGTTGLLAGLMLGYRFRDAWAAEAGYNMTYLSSSFTGPLERLSATGTWATRSDLDHMVMLGLSYAR